MILMRRRRLFHRSLFIVDSATCNHERGWGWNCRDCDVPNGKFDRHSMTNRSSRVESEGSWPVQLCVPQHRAHLPGQRDPGAGGLSPSKIATFEADLRAVPLLESSNPIVIAEFVLSEFARNAKPPLSCGSFCPPPTPSNLKGPAEPRRCHPIAGLYGTLRRPKTHSTPSPFPSAVEKSTSSTRCLQKAQLSCALTIRSSFRSGRARADSNSFPFAGAAL